MLSNAVGVDAVACVFGVGVRIDAGVDLGYVKAVVGEAVGWASVDDVGLLAPSCEWCADLNCIVLQVFRVLLCIIEQELHEFLSQACVG